jgi:hypothetical protein
MSIKNQHLDSFKIESLDFDAAAVLEKACPYLLPDSVNTEKFAFFGLFSSRASSIIAGVGKYNSAYKTEATDGKFFQFS